jgi:hypothetical protein
LEHSLSHARLMVALGLQAPAVAVPIMAFQMFPPHRPPGDGSAAARHGGGLAEGQADWGGATAGVAEACLDQNEPEYRFHN